MASDGFDDFDGFGDDDFNFGFDDSDKSNDSNSNANDEFSNGLDDGFGDGLSDGFDLDDQGSSNSGIDLDLGNNKQGGNSENTSNSSVKRNAVIAIIVSVVLFIIVLVVASMITGAKKKKALEQMQPTQPVQQVVQQQQVIENKNVDDIMSNGKVNKDVVVESNKEVKETVIVNTKEPNFVWSDITKDENVQFVEDYTEMTFTITQIQHKARVVDTNGNLVIKSTLLGSVSGLPGTYEIDIPYEKGTKLNIGNSFKVYVKLGTFNDKTVVGDITY